MGKAPSRVICRNEVFIEGVSVGQFEAFTMKADHRSFGATATLTIPLYGVGIEKRSAQSPTRSAGRANARILSRYRQINVNICAEVEVYCWYEGFDKVRVFHGFVEHISEGFPVTLHLRDGSFILKFGTIEKGWSEDAKLQEIVQDCLPVANEAFKMERNKYGFSRDIAPLQYSLSDKNVQAFTTPLSFKNYAAGRAPFEIVQHLMQYLVMYAGVDDDNNVYIGTGVADTTRPSIKLDTRYNVIDREIIPIDGRFVDYDVKVSGVLKDGKIYTATGGLRNSRSVESRSDFGQLSAVSHRSMCNLDTVEGIQDFANRMLADLKGNYNKGSITMLLYPKVQLLDHVDYNDTIFDIYDAKYYVTSYTFSASDSGYFQKIEVTDLVFML